ncbi:electron carrier [Ciborinia camelliae]|nr:electron carrier [Ciborinia camelliae]
MKFGSLYLQGREPIRAYKYSFEGIHQCPTWFSAKCGLLCRIRIKRTKHTERNYADGFAEKRGFRCGFRHPNEPLTQHIKWLYIGEYDDFEQTVQETVRTQLDDSAAVPLYGKRKSVDMTGELPEKDVPKNDAPKGVGFIDFSDDFDNSSARQNA